MNRLHCTKDCILFNVIAIVCSQDAYYDASATVRICAVDGKRSTDVPTLARR